ncbi:tyrosine-type recombinase/integrase [Bauldia litoralis]|uniref:tyrosine-type recombinase/integrase n=1 Tax=Bauldia litoralis TaxID=665467 RepID=UPI00326726B6
MKGNITRRGKESWRLKFDAGRDPATGKRKIQYHTFRGTKRQAQVKLAELIASIGAGCYVEPSKLTVADFVRARVDQWESAGDISARTAQRYRQLIENQIVPHLGAMPLQRLKPLDIEAWHTTLRTSGRVRGQGGVAARTIGHAQRVLSKALSEAVKNDLLARNVCSLETAPKVPDSEMLIVHDVPGLMAKLPSTRLHIPAMTALFTGMRLGEVLALRWNRVDLDTKVIQVREALEHTKAHGTRSKLPKSKAGRRDITLPEILVETLREFRKDRLELRMQIGAGKLPDDDLLFGDINGNVPSPNGFSAAWADFAKSIGMPEITFHALRHTHASQLIDAGVDIVTISRRLGHAKPDITLRTYAHLFQKDDAKAADAINAALGAN